MGVLVPKKLRLKFSEIISDVSVRNTVVKKKIYANFLQRYLLTCHAVAVVAHFNVRSVLN
jgi:hypothetical protein